MRPTLLITNAIHPTAHAQLEKDLEVKVLPSPSIDCLVREIGDADALLVRMPITPEVIRAGRKLRVVARHGVGLDYIPVQTCTERRIPVVFTPDANTESVAEHVLASMIMLAHEIGRADRAVRAGRWSVRNSMMGIDIRRRTIGIVGLGRIGARVAEICSGAFSMRVLAFDAHLDHETIRARGAEPRTLDGLLAEADFVTLNTPLTEQTRHLLGARAIGQMKRGAYLINHARGALVDTRALTQALASGHLRGAALDVLEQEPPPADLDLLRLDNVVITPHSAALTDEAMLRMAGDAGEDILRVLRGERPRACANPEVLGGAEPTSPIG